MGKPVLFRILLGLLLLADTTYTFRQNLGKPLDGDIVPIVLPSPHYQKVLQDPFGFRAIRDGEHYAGPNRYFAHATMRTWYRQIFEATALLFPDRIERLYILSALFNTLTQLLLVFLLTVYITGHARIRETSFLLPAVLLMPLFQVHGMYDVIGVVDQAVSYTFFYAFPVALLLLYLLPFYRAFRNREQLSFGTIRQLTWILLAVYLAFSGPLIAPLFMLFMGMLVFAFIMKNRTFIRQGSWRQLEWLPRTAGSHFLWMTLLCGYSFFLGTYNSENLVDLPLVQRYGKLFEGIGHVLLSQGALPVLLGWLFLNILLIRNKGIDQPPLGRKLGLWLGAFMIVYLLMLPLGGYRLYRPLVIRYDTFMPVTLILFFLCMLTASYLLQRSERRMRNLYLIPLIGVLLFFTLRDKPQFSDRDCQRETLYQIRDAQEPVAYVGNACTELTWWAGYDTAGTRNISEMLYQWGITDHYQAFGGEKP